jgi:hypothetical protein
MGLDGVELIMTVIEGTTVPRHGSVVRLWLTLGWKNASA